MKVLCISIRFFPFLVHFIPDTNWNKCTRKGKSSSIEILTSSPYKKKLGQELKKEIEKKETRKLRQT